MRSVVVAVLLVGCTQSPKPTLSTRPGSLCLPPVFVVLDQSLPEAYDTAIDRAFDFWSDTIGRRMFIKLGRAEHEPVGDESFVYVSPASFDRLAEWEKWARTTGRKCSIARAKQHRSNSPGFVCSRGGQVWVDVFEIDDDHLWLVLAHELGHILGFEHSKQEGTIMFPSIGKSTRPVVGLDTEIEIMILYW